MKEKRDYIRVRIIDPGEKNFGKVIDVYKMADTRFFANRWGAKYGDRAYFGDQLSFNPDEPIPVMYTMTTDERGPWTLGFVHPDDIKKVTPKKETSNRYGKCYVRVNRNALNGTLYVFDMHDGVPAVPVLVSPLSRFKAPVWSPSWNWNNYCENRELSKKAE